MPRTSDITRAVVAKIRPNAILGRYDAGQGLLVADQAVSSGTLQDWADYADVDGDSDEAEAEDGDDLDLSILEEVGVPPSFLKGVELQDDTEVEELGLTEREAAEVCVGLANLIDELYQVADEAEETLEEKTHEGVGSSGVERTGVKIGMKITDRLSSEAQMQLERSAKLLLGTVLTLFTHLSKRQLTEATNGLIEVAPQKIQSAREKQQHKMRQTDDVADTLSAGIGSADDGSTFLPDQEERLRGFEGDGPRDTGVPPADRGPEGDRDEDAGSTSDRDEDAPDGDRQRDAVGPSDDHPSDDDERQDGDDAPPGEAPSPRDLFEALEESEGDESQDADDRGE